MIDTLALAHVVLSLAATVVALLILLLTLRVLVALRAYLGEFIAHLGSLVPQGQMPPPSALPHDLGTSPDDPMPVWWAQWLATQEERQRDGDGTVPETVTAADQDIWDPLEASARLAQARVRAAQE